MNNGLNRFTNHVQQLEILVNKAKEPCIMAF